MMRGRTTTRHKDFFIKIMVLLMALAMKMEMVVSRVGLVIKIHKLDQSHSKKSKYENRIERMY